MIIGFAGHVQLESGYSCMYRTDRTKGGDSYSRTAGMKSPTLRWNVSASVYYCLTVKKQCACPQALECRRESTDSVLVLGAGI